MAFSRRTLSIVTVLVLVALVGGGIWWRLRPEAEAEASEAAAGEADSLGVDVTSASSQFSTDIPQPVEGAPVIRDTLWISVRAAGRAEAVRRATVQAQVDGVIQSIPVRENTRVTSDQPLLQIDSTELALAVAEARSQLTQAEADFQVRMLQAGEIEDPDRRAQREEYARAQSGLTQAQVRLQQAELDLRRSTVRAPFEGRVADLEVVAGQHVSAGTELMTVVDLDPIKVEAEVLEAELGLLAEGRRATVSFAAFPGETFSGRIESINPVVSDDRTGRATILLDNPRGRVKPGMYAEVAMEARSFPDRVLVPRSAILQRGQGLERTMLFVYNEEEEGRGIAEWRYVTTGRENEELVEIVPSEEGMVEPGEIVLTDAHHYLAHQTVVRLVENAAVEEGGRPTR
jgi:RND family efflux transporter MFP subunit